MKKLNHLLSIFILAMLVACTANHSKVVPDLPNADESTMTIDIVDMGNVSSIKCAADAGNRVEVRARHVVVEFPLKVTEVDIKNARSKALDARSELINGKPFSEVEGKYSSGAYSRGVNGGDLGFFKKKVMVKEFEDLAFCLPVNQLSPIFSTDFGYHVLEVTEVKFATQ